MSRSTRVLVGAVCAAGVAALVAWQFLARIRFANGSPYPLGIDGYYYPIQVRSLLETGGLHYPSAPLALWLMAPFAWIAGPIEGAKILAALGTATAAIPAYFVGKRLGGGERGPGLIAAVVIAASAQSFYLSAEFVKQGLGMTVALAFVAVLGATLDRPSRLRVAGAAALFAATLFTHKVAAAIALLVGLPAVAIYAWRQASPRARRWILGGTGGLVVFLVASVWVVGAVAPRRFVSPRDLAQLGSMFRADPGPLVVLTSRNGHSLHFNDEVQKAALLALVALVAWGLALIARHWRPARERLAAAKLEVPRLPPLAIGFLVLALVLALPWIDVRDEQAMGMRLRLTAHVAMAALAALAAHRLLWPAPALVRAGLTAGFAAAFALSQLVGAFTHPRETELARREGIVLTHPALANGVRALDGVLPPGGEVIVPERHVLFMAAWYARVPARLEPRPDSDPAKTFRLLPGALIQPPLRKALDDLRAAPPAGVPLPRDLHAFEPNGLVLLAEPTFQYLLTRLPPETRAHYEAWPTQ